MGKGPVHFTVGDNFGNFYDGGGGQFKVHDGGAPTNHPCAHLWSVGLRNFIE